MNESHQKLTIFVKAREIRAFFNGTPLIKQRRVSSNVICPSNHTFFLSSNEKPSRHSKRTKHHLKKCTRYMIMQFHL